MKLTKKEFLAKIKDYPNDAKVVIDYFDFGEADFILVPDIELRINKECPDCIIIRAIVPIRGRNKEYSLKGVITQEERNAIVVGLHQLKEVIARRRLTGKE